MSPEPRTSRRAIPPLNVVAIRIGEAAIDACQALTPAAWRVTPARYVHKACDLLRRGDVDLVIASADVRPWDVHVLREVTQRHATELLVLREGGWPDDLAEWLEGARSRRALHVRRTKLRPASEPRLPSIVLFDP